METYRRFWEDTFDRLDDYLRHLHRTENDVNAPTTNNATTLTLPSDREILIERTFAAPRRLVFEALTNPEHVAHWYGPRAMTLQVCEIDFRVGGRWRYVLLDPAGHEHGF